MTKRLIPPLVGALLVALPAGLLPALLTVPLLRMGVWFDTGPGALLRPSADARARYEASLIDDARPALDAIDAWFRVADTSLARPMPVSLPYRERLSYGQADAGRRPPSAQTFAIDLGRDDVLRVATSQARGATGGLVLDVYRAAPEPATTARQSRPALVGSYGPAPVEVRIPVDRAGPYLVRVQATLGASGGFGLVLQRRTTLDFPVLTDAEEPVRSVFGDPRDGGRRQHHGIDIFAPRGTPIVAAAEGIVVRTGDSGLGGKHVWQQAFDDTGARIGALYYAHLDRIDVRVGDRLVRGMPIGTVGNTGNARTTPPHLHFGLYRRYRGPEDPLPLTGTRRTTTIAAEAGHALPAWLRVEASRANVRAGPGTTFDAVGALDRQDLVRVGGLAANDRWVRIESGTGESGYIARSLLGPLRDTNAAPLASIAADETFELLADTRVSAPLLATLSADDEVRVLGRFGAALRVVTGDGLIGWLRQPSDS